MGLVHARYAVTFMVNNPITKLTITFVRDATCPPPASVWLDSVTDEKHLSHSHSLILSSKEHPVEIYFRFAGGGTHDYFAFGAWKLMFVYLLVPDVRFSAWISMNSRGLATPLDSNNPRVVANATNAPIEVCDA